MKTLPHSVVIRASLIILAACFSRNFLSAQLAEEMTVRYNLGRYVNGVYEGLVYGETRLFVSSDGTGGAGTIYQYRLEDLTSDGRFLARQLSSRMSAEFRFGDSGAAYDPRYATEYTAEFDTLWVDPASDVLVFQNFPVQPPGALSDGMVWQAPAAYLTDPLRSGNMTRIPVLAEYRVLGTGSFNGSPVWNVQTRYALRYGGTDPHGDPSILGASGAHTGTVQYAVSDDPAEQLPVFAAVSTDETYTVSGRCSVRLRGSFALFFTDSLPYRYTPPVRIAGAAADSGSTPRSEPDPVPPEPENAEDNPDAQVSLIESLLAESRTADIAVTRVSEGYNIDIRNLLFVADQAVLLPDEWERLDAIAEILHRFPERQFLVTGHTADIGSIESQINLSILRARAVVDALAARGIEPRRLMYEGRGGFYPVAENTTEEGRRQNRRVEITILSP